MTPRPPPDWQLPPGVSRGVWEYLHAPGIAAEYDASVADSSLFQCDVAFVRKHCRQPGRLIDLGCGTGRLLVALAGAGHAVTGVDLSPEMLKVARAKIEGAGVSAELIEANLTDLGALPAASFDYAACLFSTLGMIAGEEHRLSALKQAARVLRPGGVFVLHVHNRWFNVWNPEGRRWLVGNTFGNLLGRAAAGDRPMPPHQGIGGWTMHLFTRRELRRVLREAGFTVRELKPVGLGKDGNLPWSRWFPALRAYGYLIAATKSFVGQVANLSSRRQTASFQLAATKEDCPMRRVQDFSHIPIIDVGADDHWAIASQLGTACRESGFFYVVGHAVDEDLQRQLCDLSKRFFALDVETKMRISMAHGGRAWRGYFRVGDELTSGKPDQKEGLYFGAEFPADHPLVRAGTPLHGPNLFPSEPADFREVVLSYMAALTQLGHRLMAGLALSLGLHESYFAERITGEPLTLFRIFNYPPPRDAGLWGVGEHTDYGLLTILLQDNAGGLEVRSRSGWVAAPPIPGSFVCNIGDMLDRMTGGRYRSTPHRVRNPAPRDRLSFPYFFDPNFFARVQPIGFPADDAPPDDQDERWDKASVHLFQGTYGEYLLNKVAKVFPQLRTAL